MDSETNDLASVAKDIRKSIIEMSYKAKAHHIGSCLSCVEILVALYAEVMKPEDKFILSAGHKAFALYAVLEGFRTVYFNAKKACHHPERSPAFGIEATTGSLGHGLSIGCGMALADPSRNIYVLMSDGELQEGSVWEAIMFAGHHRLSNLTMIIDYNRLQALGSLAINLDPLSTKIEVFYWRGYNISGHFIPGIIEYLQKDGDWPKFILAHTTKGKGISFMENNNDWHYNTLDEETYKRAIMELHDGLSEAEREAEWWMRTE